jgi:outer membrane protein OmpA-like peptidoglycan-associated protein
MLAGALKDNPASVVELIGHTDMQGTDAANRAFALQKAQALKKTFIAR